MNEQWAMIAMLLVHGMFPVARRSVVAELEQVKASDAAQRAESADVARYASRSTVRGFQQQIIFAVHLSFHHRISSYGEAVIFGSSTSNTVQTPDAVDYWLNHLP